MGSENQLLAGLPARDRAEFLARVEPVLLPRGKALLELGDAIEHAYFPTSGLISLLGVTPNDQAIELAMVGTEGFVGLSAVLRGAVSPYNAVVQIPGTAQRVRADVLRGAARESPVLQETLLRYAHDLHVQIAGSVLCHHFHTAPQRLSQWLLRAGSRIGSDTLDLTHELLAQVLGIPRTAVTRAAVELQDAGHISYRHGHIVIKNRRQLKMTACDCYRAHDRDDDRDRSVG